MEDKATEIARRNAASFATLRSLQGAMEVDPRLEARFAGAFLDDDGSLVINVTEYDPAFRVGGASIRIVRHSLRQLQATYEALINAGIEGRSSPISVIAMSEKENKVVVYVKNQNPETLALLRSLVDLSTLDIRIGTIVKIEFQGASMPVQQTARAETTDIGIMSATIQPQMRNRTSGISSTIGFRARRNGVSGFVTTFHGNASIGNPVYLGDTTTQIGAVGAQSFTDGVDAAWVRLSSSHSISTTFTNGETYSTILDYFVQNLPVAMYGGVSQKQAGRIVHTSYTVISNGTPHPVLRDVVAANYFSQVGDSGSAVTWTFYHDSEGNEIIVGGVHSAQITLSDGTVLRLFCKTGAVMQRLGLTAW
jgi:hypothetical protein